MSAHRSKNAQTANAYWQLKLKVPVTKQTNKMPVAFHLIMAGLAILLMAFLIHVGGGIDGLWPVTIGIGFIFGLSWLYSTMSIEISQEGIRWSFRWKLSGGFIPIAEIREAEITYLGWQVGYGHRWTKRGPVYRAWGLDVVQIHRQKGKPVFLGANDAAAMVKAIEQGQE
ncbi:MAG: hypothetical protein ACRCT6_00840, partial [Notoacmeibacter sp.]